MADPIQNERPPRLLNGPPSWENWRAAEVGVPSLGGYEVSLYTDAHVTGELREGYGPYQFLNPVCIGERPGLLLPAIVLRGENHLVWDMDRIHELMSRTDASRYHGGWLNDEIAALTALCLGIRCKAGPVTRQFEPDHDPRGRPVGHDTSPEPVLVAFPNAIGRMVVPNSVGTHALDGLDRLRSYPGLDPLDAIALIRAARLYQDGIWIAESEPAMSWLMLVSAVETAAHRWREDEPTVERLRISRPELADLLTRAGGEELVSAVADLIAPYMGATSKFINFLLTFLPDPPSSRPSEFGQIEWTPKTLKRIFSMVYNYRSKTLHGGMPFPAPMCEGPGKLGDTGLVEKPLGASMTLGSIWRAEDAPILLHTFEYIARGALLRWWDALANTAPHDDE